MNMFKLVVWLVFLVGFPVHVRAQGIVCPQPGTDAESNKVEARRYFHMGNSYFETDKFRESADSFSCVLQFIPYSVVARYRLAQSLDRLGLYTKAREHYQWVLANPAEEAQVLKPDVEKRLGEIRDLADLREETVQPDKPWNRWWFWTGAGVTAGFAALTVYSGLRVMELNDRWERNWQKRDLDELNRFRRYTDIALGTTLLSAVGLGVAVWLFRPEKPSDQVQVTMFPACDSAGCMLSLSLGF